jgi:hypothetical protein
MRVPEQWHRANLAFLGTLEKLLTDFSLSPEKKIAYIGLALTDLKEAGKKARVYG